MQRKNEIDWNKNDLYRTPVPKDIVKLFPGIPLEEDYEKGRGVEVDILIGLDWYMYWPLIKKQERSLEGLVAQETAFGWMLSESYLNRK